MNDLKTDKRTQLALSLLRRLKEERNHIYRIKDDLGSSSSSFLREVYEENTGQIREKIDQFNKNVDKVKELNLTITAKINEWFAFVKSEKEQKSLLFPLKMYLRRKKIKSEIRDIKNEITSLGIKGRLMGEDIKRFQSTLEQEAAKKLKKDVRFEDYLHHLEIKSRLIEEISYILPTIAGHIIHEFSIDHIEDAISALERI